MADNWQLKAVLSAVDNMSPVLKNIGNVAKTARKYLSDVGGAAGNLSGKIGMPMAAISGILSGFSLVAVKNAVVGFTYGRSGAERRAQSRYVGRAIPAHEVCGRTIWHLD